jgi:prepilin-type N-terminal cleavage/methylation domain-containing protein
MNRRGFTLLEILLVVALMALLAGAATFKLTQTLRSTTSDDVAGRIIELDDLARTRARNSRAATELTFQLNGGKAFYAEVNESHPRSRLSFGRCRPCAILTADGSRSAGTVSIACSPLGYSLSYAVEISEPSGDRQKGRRRWICFAGLTGDSEVFDDEKRAWSFVRAATASGDDAN